MLYKQNIKLLSASAGSGKTKALIDELSKLIISNNPSTVVAITFTKAAANEIKERIILNLKELKIELDISSLFIGTMHSFFSKIIRENSYKLALSSDYKIIDDNEAAYIKEVLFKKTYLSFYKNSDYKFIYSIYTYSSFKKIIYKLFNKAYLINDKLKTRSKYTDEEYEFLNLYFQKLLAKFIFNFKFIKEASNFSIEDNFNIQIKEIYKKLVDSENLIQNYKDNANFYNISKLVDFFLSLNFEFNLRFKPTKKAWLNVKDPNIYISAVKEIKYFIDEIYNNKDIFKQEFIEKSATTLYLFIEFYREFFIQYKNYKYLNNVLDFSDIELYSYDLIKNNNELSSEYKNKFKYILVDEFQDTNHIQKEIIFSLTNNLFLVGDAKQSIYGFRSADLRVFNNMLKEVKSINLNYNYRSSNNIINFVNVCSNKIFNEYINEKESYHSDFINMIAKPGNYNNEGKVEILDVHENNFNYELIHILNIIKKSILENFNYKDIYILLRNNKELTIINRFLTDNNIPSTIYGDAGINDLIFFISNVLKSVFNPYDNYNFMHLLRLPIFFVSEEVLFNLKNELYFESILAYNLDENLLNFKSEDINSIHNLKIFFYNYNKLSNFNLSYNLSFIFNELKLNEAIKALYSHFDTDLEEYVYNISSKYNTFNDFINVFEKLNVSNELDNDLNSVKILTVHKSKGLQNKIIIMPRLDFKRVLNDELVISYDGDISVKLPVDYTPTWKKTAKYISILQEEEARDTAEARRLLYVALTRAEERLYLIGNFSKKEKLKDLNNAYKWNDLIASMNGIIDTKENTSNEINNIFKVLPRKIYIDSFKMTKLMSEASNLKLNVSQIKDYIYCPYLFLRKSINDDLNYSSTSGVNKGAIIHKYLETYNYKENIKFSEDIDLSLKSKLKLFLASDLAKSIFRTGNFLNEVSFKYKLSDTLIVGRIDRLNLEERSVKVIDYKTFIDASDKKTFYSYINQIYFYAYYLEQVYKGCKIGASLVDVSNIKEYKVDLNLDLKNYLTKTISEIKKFLVKENYNLLSMNCNECKIVDLCNKFKA